MSDGVLVSDGVIVSDSTLNADSCVQAMSAATKGDVSNVTTIQVDTGTDCLSY